jgi:hypothetical protein
MPKIPLSEAAEMPTALDLRCMRCKHHFDHHGPNGCKVCKIHFDANGRDLGDSARCTCRWYLGDMPPLREGPKCPHEVQDEVDKMLCVHCGAKVPSRYSSKRSGSL